jgi:hypothetical protein
MNFKLPQKSRRGVASLLALLFVAIVAMMAVGFYASTTTASQMAHNHSRTDAARLAAETGMEFMRHQLSKVSVTGSTDVSAQVFADLATLIDSSTNMATAIDDDGGLLADAAVGTVVDGTTIELIRVPETGWIKTDADGTSAFRATIRETGDHLVVAVEGRHIASGLTRAVSMSFNRQTSTNSVFDFAVAAKGGITIDGNEVTSTTGVSPTIVSIMSAMVANPSIQLTKPKSTVGGDISIVAGGGALISSGSVAGKTNPATIAADHVHTVDNPDFPYVDPEQYRTYATTVYNSTMAGGGGKKGSSGSTLQNVRIPANTNPTFNSNVTIQGVLFIESPNTVSFRGNASVQGFIVMQDTGSTAGNLLDFRGNCSQSPLPAGAAFDTLRAVSGVSILAPSSKIVMSGSVDSNVRGSIICHQFENAGSANLTIDAGTLLAYDTSVNAVKLRANNKWIKFSSTGAGNLPSLGVSLAQSYRATPSSYAELEAVEVE